MTALVTTLLRHIDLMVESTKKNSSLSPTDSIKWLEAHGFTVTWKDTSFHVKAPGSTKPEINYLYSKPKEATLERDSETWSARLEDDICILLKNARLNLYASTIKALKEEEVYGNLYDKLRNNSSKKIESGQFTIDDLEPDDRLNKTDSAQTVLTIDPVDLQGYNSVAGEFQKNQSPANTDQIKPLSLISATDVGCVIDMMRSHPQKPIGEFFTQSREFRFLMVQDDIVNIDAEMSIGDLSRSMFQSAHAMSILSMQRTLLNEINNIDLDEKKADEVKRKCAFMAHKALMDLVTLENPMAVKRIDEAETIVATYQDSLNTYLNSEDQLKPIGSIKDITYLKAGEKKNRSRSLKYSIAVDAGSTLVEKSQYNVEVAHTTEDDRFKVTFGVNLNKDFQVEDSDRSEEWKAAYTTLPSEITDALPKRILHNTDKLQKWADAYTQYTQTPDLFSSSNRFLGLSNSWTQTVKDPDGRVLMKMNTCSHPRPSGFLNEELLGKEKLSKEEQEKIYNAITKFNLERFIQPTTSRLNALTKGTHQTHQKPIILRMGLLSSSMEWETEMINPEQEAIDKIRKENEDACIVGINIPLNALRNLPRAWREYPQSTAMNLARMFDQTFINRCGVDFWNDTEDDSILKEYSKDKKEFSAENGRALLQAMRKYLSNCTIDDPFIKKAIKIIDDCETTYEFSRQWINHFNPKTKNLSKTESPFMNIATQINMFTHEANLVLKDKKGDASDESLAEILMGCKSGKDRTFAESAVLNATIIYKSKYSLEPYTTNKKTGKRKYNSKFLDLFEKLYLAGIGRLINGNEDCYGAVGIQNIRGEIPIPIKKGYNISTYSLFDEDLLAQLEKHKSISFRHRSKANKPIDMTPAHKPIDMTPAHKPIDMTPAPVDNPQEAQEASYKDPETPGSNKEVQTLYRLSKLPQKVGSLSFEEVQSLVSDTTDLMQTNSTEFSDFPKEVQAGLQHIDAAVADVITTKKAVKAIDAEALNTAGARIDGDEGVSKVLSETLPLDQTRHDLCEKAKAIENLLQKTTPPRTAPKTMPRSFSEIKSEIKPELHKKLSALKKDKKQLSLIKLSFSLMNHYLKQDECYRHCVHDALLTFARAEMPESFKIYCTQGPMHKLTQEEKDGFRTFFEEAIESIKVLTQEETATFTPSVRKKLDVGYHNPNEAAPPKQKKKISASVAGQVVSAKNKKIRKTKPHTHASRPYKQRAGK